MEIKDKTIFDFCKDENLRKEIIGGDYSEDYYKGFRSEFIYEDMVEYAAKVNNHELFKAAKKARDKAHKEFGKRAFEAMEKGWLID